MKYNFRAIVDGHKLPTSAPLLPLFEAIVNSIQSIQESGKIDGLIQIKIIRDVPISNCFYWETDIYSFEIVDNGTGFNDKNYNSFDIYGSDYKLAMGCKGVGRVLWLKAFSKVEVESTYLGEDGKFYDRDFNFSVVDERKEIRHCESGKKATFAKVTLLNYSNKYKKKCPKRIDTLSRDIMNHCFAYLALGTCPKIIISDDEETRCINEIFNEHTKGQIQVDNFNVNGATFSLISARNYAPTNDKHMLHYCAHNREVFGENLSTIIKGLTGKLFNDDGEFVYSGYITGSLLDENINSERTDFSFAKTQKDEVDADVNEQLELEDVDSDIKVSKQAIVNEIIPIVNKFLEYEISKYNLQKKERIEKYVFSKNPRYRSLIKHYGECIERISLTSDDAKLELELFKQEQLYRLFLKTEQQAVLSNDKDSTLNINYAEKSAKFLEKISDMGKDDLANYIVHRKTMLDILERALEYVDSENNSYALEKNIHQLIFPMVTTSDDIEYDKHNLWIIDEKLAYHYYLEAKAGRA